jgi:uncharacterized cupin superfamily protein
VSEHIVHWDDVPFRQQEAGGIRSSWANLGDAAGTRNVGLNRIRVEPGARSTPLHCEGAEEEIFYVLAGAGLSWQHDGEREHTYEIRAGDCLVHLREEGAHSVVAGPDGIEVLAFGTRVWAGWTWFPRIEAMRVGPGVLDVPDRHQWPMEAALGEPDLPDPEPRPPSIVNVDEVEPEIEDRGTFAWEWRKLARTAVVTGLNRETAPPGKLNCPPHCHSAEEEIFVVLEGEGACLLGDEEHPVHAGHVIARPPATRVAHAFRGGGEHGLTLLSYGTREPNDIAYYPRSKKVFFRGVGLITRVEQLDYWDGE